MKSIQMFNAGLAFAALAVVATAQAMTTPKVGETAPDFTVRTLEQKPVELSVLTAQGPVVLVVLRGWPGYQCPLCTRQVQDYIAQAAKFKERGAQVVMIYPGPAEQLEARAGEFLKNKDWPAEFVFATDPGYGFTNRYSLRWDAKKETAYPSTFVIDREGRVRFAYVSKSHGDRVSAARVLAALDDFQPQPPMRPGK